MKSGLAAAALLAAVLLFPAASTAHPHVWADVRIKVLFDEQGRVRALRQSWLFDDYYSAFVLAGADMDKDGTPDQSALDAVLVENMKNLADYDYFSRVYSGATRLETEIPTATATKVVENRLEMSFELPLKTHVAANDLPFRYAIFDPTYYIEMVHADADDAVTLDAAPAGCSASIAQPDPDPEKVMLAASLDRTQSAGDGLGQYFAETVRVTCG